ncbi:C69 family dipeptidase, partial [Streptococcus pneumoniae]
MTSAVLLNFRLLTYSFKTSVGTALIKKTSFHTRFFYPHSCLKESSLFSFYTKFDAVSVLSSHYQGTPYDPYEGHGDPAIKGIFRPIGINRNDFMALIQMRPDVPEESRVVEWIAFASNAFNVLAPFYANVSATPEYLANTTKEISTDNFYWSSRIIAAMADASYGKSVFHIERYQLAVQSKGHALIS